MVAAIEIGAVIAFTIAGSIKAPPPKASITKLEAETKAQIRAEVEAEMLTAAEAKKAEAARAKARLRRLRAKARAEAKAQAKAEVKAKRTALKRRKVPKPQKPELHLVPEDQPDVPLKAR